MKTKPILPLACAALLAACGATPPSTGDEVAAVAASAASDTLTDPASGARCDGKDLRLTRDNMQWVINGSCRDITITASHGSLNVDDARSITVEGSDFTVLNAQVGEVRVGGSRNTLNLTRSGRIQLDGDANMVLGTDIPEVGFGGSDNTVNASGKPKIHADAGTGNRVM